LRRAALAESPWTATSKYCFITLSAWKEQTKWLRNTSAIKLRNHVSSVKKSEVHKSLL
jgi:hypothetical protein